MAIGEQAGARGVILSRQVDRDVGTVDADPSDDAGTGVLSLSETMRLGFAAEWLSSWQESHSGQHRNGFKVSAAYRSGRWRFRPLQTSSPHT